MSRRPRHLAGGGVPGYDGFMTILHALVKNGRVVVEEPTNLPDGARVELLVLDAGEDMAADEQTALDASLGRGLEQAARGEVHSVDEVLAKLRRI
jgi:hypothetical protein